MRTSFYSLLAVLTTLASPASAEDFDLSVMTYNVLVELSAPPGIAPWRQRRDASAELIARQNPDLIGLQECTPRQLKDLLDRLKVYDSVHDEKFTDAALLYKKDLFECLETGHWWLSPEPTKRMSKGFGNFLPRLLVWAKLRHKPTGTELFAASTHFDNTTPSQTKMARLCQDLLKPLTVEGQPMIWVGDFNTDQSRGDYPTLVSNGWKDAYVASPKASPDGRDDNAPTFPGSDARRIDHIFYRGPITPLAWEVLLYPEGTPVLSDHYPVLAKLRVAR